jgi:hypothetical protein
MAYGYEDIPADCPFEWFWIVAADGTVKRAKGYKVADAFPDLGPAEKFDYSREPWKDGVPMYDFSRPWYLIPDGPYRSTRPYIYDTPAQAALVALDRHRKVMERQEAVLESVEAALRASTTPAGVILESSRPRATMMFMKRSPNTPKQPKVRSHIGLAAHQQTGGGKHGGSSRQQRRRDRQSTKRALRAGSEA